MSSTRYSPVARDPSSPMSQSSRLSSEMDDNVQSPVAVDEKMEPMPVKKTSTTALYILFWILMSNMTILFNKWLIDTQEFRFPIILTCWHLVFATIATQILARTTTLLDSRKKIPITPRIYAKSILPIGIFYSGSLVCSNIVYLYLSVPFIQILKAGAPIAVLFTSWAFRVAEPSWASFLNVLWIFAGVALASVGEIQFSLIGFLYQMGGIVFEAVRIVMIQVLLNGDMKMDPLVGLYYFAPVCAVMNFLVAVPTELHKFSWEAVSKAGIVMLILNASIAFLLNISSVFLIGRTSGLVMTLTSILKNILLIIVSVIIWSTKITVLQAFGYAIALGGLFYYSLGHDQIVKLFQSSKSWAWNMWPASQTKRTCIVVFGVIFSAVFIAAAALLHYNPEANAKILSLLGRIGTQ